MDGEGNDISHPMKRQDSKSCGLLPTSISFLDNGNERSVEENQVISVKNNHVENIEEP